MKKNKFIKSSIILILGGMITKVVGMITKIVLTRHIGTLGIGLYSMIMPTFLLLISISGFGLTTALNVLISSDKYNNKNLIITSLIISLSIDFIILLILFLFSNFISFNLLHNEVFKYPILSIGFVLPFISISNILRSYFFSKERMLPHVISNILEDIVKLILIALFINYFLKNKASTLCFIIIINIFSELSSIIIFIYKLPKFKIDKKDITPNKNNIKQLMKISIPTTISRLIGSITYFLEPIILTSVLTKVGYTNTYIISEYGIINGYVLPIILLPSFFMNAISQALIPTISKSYFKKDYKKVKNKLNQALIIATILGILFTIVIIIFGKTLLHILYNTNQGINYIYLLTPIFLFHYIEHPLLSTLQAMNKAKINMRISIINMIIRTLLLGILCMLRIKMYGFVISLSLNILFPSFYAWYCINKILKNKKNALTL